MGPMGVSSFVWPGTAVVPIGRRMDVEDVMEEGSGKRVCFCFLCNFSLQ